MRGYVSETTTELLMPAMRRLAPEVRIHPELDELFAIWFTNLFEPTTGLTLSEDEIRRLHMETGMSMIQQTVDRWRGEATEAGMEEGREEGREAGKLEVLARMLELEFGPDADRTSRLRRLDGAQLDRLTELLVRSPERPEGELFAELEPEEP